MPAFVIGALWAALVAYLVGRLVRQGRAFDAAALPSPCQCPVSHDVTIVVPMRDELPNIDACLQSLLGQRDLSGRWEVVVVDDNSTDGTAKRLQQLSAAEPRLRVIRASLLPPGWTGKSHACWLGAAASRSEWPCFVDADLRGAPMLVASAIAAARDMEIDMLSLSPFQELGVLGKTADRTGTATDNRGGAGLKPDR
jgi:glycosyltransferase involved in cell wall biosynthesis